MHIKYLPIFKDNYIWLIINDENNQVVAIDPGEALALQSFLCKENLQLTDILLTHHHADHVGGVLDLLVIHNPNVYGPAAENIKGVTRHLKGRQQIFLETHDICFEILLIPGHTLGHIAYYNPQYKILFCGDTLFSAGCGRIFEGTGQQMYASLQLINSLPDDTLIYCTHEYTLNNLKFALTIEPDNNDIYIKIATVEEQLRQGKISLPTLLAEERKFNPFLRCAEPSIVKNLQKSFRGQLNPGLQTFMYLRKLKDVY